MKSRIFLLIVLIIFFNLGCKKGLEIDKNEAFLDVNKFKYEVVNFLSKQLDVSTFSQLNLEKIKDNLTYNKEQQTTLIVYFKTESGRKNDFITIVKTKTGFSAQIINISFSVVNQSQNSISGIFTKTDIVTKEKKSTAFSNKISSSVLRIETDPVQLQELIIIGRVGQSQFIISAFVNMQVAGTLIYQNIYLNGQVESVIPPEEYNNYGIPTLDLPELSFESQEEAAAYQAWVNELSPAEVAFCINNPVAAVQIFRNSKIALAKYPSWNGKLDAKRHAYWMALNSADNLVGPILAFEFGLAHETRPPINTSIFGLLQHDLETQMDMFNNIIGIQIIQYYNSFGITNISSIMIINLIDLWTDQGKLKYLCDPDGLPFTGDEVLMYTNFSCP